MPGVRIDLDQGGERRVIGVVHRQDEPIAPDRTPVHRRDSGCAARGAVLTIASVVRSMVTTRWWHRSRRATGRTPRHRWDRRCRCSRQWPCCSAWPRQTPLLICFTNVSLLPRRRRRTAALAGIGEAVLSCVPGRSADVDRLAWSGRRGDTGGSPCRPSLSYRRSSSPGPGDRNGREKLDRPATLVIIVVIPGESGACAESGDERERNGHSQQSPGCARPCLSPGDAATAKKKLVLGVASS